MSQYKVGDVAALFSKPKEATTESGKKLQSLFKEFHCKNKKFSSKTPVEQADSDTCKLEKVERVPKKQKKRKFSEVNSAESEINDTKKFKKGKTQEVASPIKHEKKQMSIEQDFPRKKKFKPNSKQNDVNSDFNFSEEDKTTFSNILNQISDVSSKLNNKSDNKTSGFVKKSKQQKQKEIDVNGVKTVKGKNNDMSAEDDFFSDTLFNEDNDEFVEKSVKKQKKKKNSDNFMQNSQSNHTDRDNSIKKESPFKNSFGDHKQKFVKESPKKGQSDFSQIEEEEKLKRTLFVGNLPVNMKAKALKSLFSPFGEVEQIRYHGIETDKAKIFSEEGSQTLNANNYAADSVPGFVTFRDRESAVKALSLSGSLFKGRHITVDFALAPGTRKIYDDKRSIFIGNLPFNCQDESVWEAFSECGRMENVRIVRDKKTGIGKGFGYVLFSTVQSKENALALEDLVIQGRTIRIKPVDSNPSSQKKSKNPPPAQSDTFKSRAIRIKMKNKDSTSRKSVKKIVKKEKRMHHKKKMANILQKAMKL